jgi:hypothetical protein
MAGRWRRDADYRKMLIALGVLVIATASFGVGALQTAGGVRVGLVVGAVIFAALAAWQLLWVGIIGGLSTLAEKNDPGFRIEPDSPQSRWTQMCREGEHSACGHWRGWEASIWRRREVRCVLCQCPCHEPCPVQGHAVPERRWRGECSCPGAEEWRQHLDKSA